jgi:hypothetical protein
MPTADRRERRDRLRFRRYLDELAYGTYGACPVPARTPEEAMSYMCAALEGRRRSRLRIEEDFIADFRRAHGLDIY